ncbi:MAG: LL-diaminopimelate aminotransferase [Phycisphaerae bacterium]
MPFAPAHRIQQLPPYLFVAIDRKKRELIAAGKDVINFGIGDPDRPTHPFVIDRLKTAVDNPAHHRYPQDTGLPAFRQAVQKFFAKRYGVELDVEKQLLSLIGSKEGLGHLALAVVNPGDTTLVPDPGYPVYHSGTIFAGGTPHVVPLREERGWLMDFSEIPTDVARKAVMLYFNYPNNPTGAVAPLSFYAEAVAFAKQHDLIIASDAAYNEMYYDEPAPSILQVPGAIERCIELHSLSKTFNMTGWRLGFAAGNADILAALAKIKSNMDSGQFSAIQEAGIAAYEGIDRPEILAARAMYKERAKLLTDGLRQFGFRLQEPRAAFYLWCGVPNGYDSMGVVNKLLDEAAVVCIPGSGFGKQGEGYVRFALTVDVERTKMALARMRELKW